MKEQVFRDWLSKRLWNGKPLTKKAMEQRVRRSMRAERGLHGLGYSLSTLDEIFDDGRWDELLAQLRALIKDPNPNMAMVRAVVPQAENPTGQLINLVSSLRQYGYFREGRDPNYSAAGLTDEDEPLEMESENMLRQKQSPTNLILYGPPGTGKTYQTAYEAVRLCDGTVSIDGSEKGREELLKRYRELEAQKRIVFVTFHQSYDYESFVEGLRPKTGDEESHSTGFRLEALPGIFREVCALAEQARIRPTREATEVDFDFTGRRFWKMSQGASGSEDDVYDAALANGYVALGWGGAIDWSDERFLSKAAIKAEWLDKNPQSQNPSNWEQTWRFRADVKKGDIVIVPFGNSAFRAIAEVISDYHYESEADSFSHRRNVRWLLTLNEPLARDTITDRNFTMRTLYEIDRERLNLPVLARLIAGNENPSRTEVAVGEPEQFVLIIDEINRANISKVFGELITLLEPDKRLGMANALTVTLPYSKKRDFGVPANLHIVGTMNTADRSIALLDTALRRRFTFKEIAPRANLLGNIDGIDLRATLTTINDRIEYLIDREHRIGHAFFMECENRKAIDLVMRDKVIPLLQEYFFEDWGRIHAVLGDGFIESRKIVAPPGIEGDERDSWFVREPFLEDAFERLIRGSGVGTSIE